MSARKFLDLVVTHAAAYSSRAHEIHTAAFFPSFDNLLAGLQQSTLSNTCYSLKLREKNIRDHSKFGISC
jgi:hypothetical protein